MNTNKIKKAVVDWIDTNKDEFYNAADTLWKYPELGMEEHNSSALLIELLEKYGFALEKDVAECRPLCCHFGKGKPVIGLSAEYDCLPGLSQKATLKKKPIVVGAPGQGCGHNLLGVAAIKAAIALKTFIGKQVTERHAESLWHSGGRAMHRKTFHGQGRAFPGTGRRP